jgi:dynein heavy chain 2
MSFDQASITNISRATAPLAAWVKANVKYSEVLLKIEPLTRELNGLMEKLQRFQIRVEECKMQLNELELATEMLN